MPLDLLQRITLIKNQDLRDRFRMASIDAAHAVIQDPQREVEHPYAMNIINNPLADDWLQKMVLSGITNPNVITSGVDVPDGDVQYIVNSFFPILALQY